MIGLFNFELELELYLEQRALCQAEESSLALASRAQPARPPSNLARKRLAVERAFRYLLPRHHYTGMHIEGEEKRKSKELILFFLRKPLKTR